jgi:hypothetical protein
VKPDRLLERSRKESVVERQADQYQAGGESTTIMSVAAGDGGWTPERTTIVGELLVGVVLRQKTVENRPPDRQEPAT